MPSGRQERPAEQGVGFYNQRDTVEQWIKEGKYAIKVPQQHDTRSPTNLANFLRTLALPQAMAHWSLTTLREKPVKIGARMVPHGRYITFQMAEVARDGPDVRADSSAVRPVACHRRCRSDWSGGR